MEFEDILLEVGDYGKYQIHLIMIFLVPAAALLPWFAMDILFMISVPDHWCNVPELTASNLTIAQQKSLISPADEQCHRYNISYTDIFDIGNYTVPNGTAKIPCDNGWQYDNTYYDQTAASLWNMVCNDAHYTSFVLSMYNVGSIIGTPIYGSLSDKIGRRITFYITVVVTAITGISAVFAKDFTIFLVIRTINGSLMPTLFQVPFIIILEIVAPEMRTRMNGLVNISWTVGMCFLPLLAYYTRNWVTLGLCTSSVTLLMFLYYKLLPESPRWLVSQNRFEEAAVIMYQIGKKNGKSPDCKDLTQKLQKLGKKMQDDKNGVESSPWDLVRYPQLRKKFIIITFCWTSNVMAYYGLQINISNLAGNEFVNFFLLAIAEIPGYLTSWYVMEKFGRRWCCVAGFLLTGFVCMLPAIEFPHGDVICSMLGKFFAASTFMATYQQSSELYPTVVRSLGMGMSSTIAITSTLVVPYLIYLAVYGKAIPFIVIGCTGIIAGIMASFLPETLNENLPQSLLDAEQFGRSQKYLSMNRRRISVSRERAASIVGIKNKPMETISESDDDESKIHRSSQTLQDVEFGPDMVQTCLSAESVNTLNGGTTRDVRKRNSTDSSPKESYEIGNYREALETKSPPNNVGKSYFNEAQEPELDGSSDDKESSKNAPAHTEEKADGQFSYANKVFDDKADVTGTETDKVFIRDGTVSPHQSENSPSKIDV